MKTSLVFGLLLLSVGFLNGQHLDDLSQNLVLAVSESKPVAHYYDQLARLSFDDLATALPSDNDKLAFWINVYNASVQYLLNKDSTLFEDRSAFFTKPRILVAGRQFSLDDFEHGILRRSTWKYSFGYFSNPFAPTWEKTLRVKKTDPRIHFALNCGATSCPPVRVYSAQGIHSQLDVASLEFLSFTTEIDELNNRIEVTSLINWFRGDFDGVAGAVDLIKSYGIIPDNADPEVTFSDYDWTLKTGVFQHWD